jgi:hypothetical protein
VNLRPFLMIKFNPSPETLPFKPTYSSRISKLTSFPRCLAKRTTISVKFFGNGELVSKYLKSSSSFSNDYPLIAVIKV